MSIPDNFQPEEARAAWLRHGLGELKHWLSHIDSKTDFLRSEEKEGRFRYIEHAELVFVLSAFLNRLAQISENTPSNLDIEKRLVPWLARMADWPDEVAGAFWFCVRNPTIHVGRAWVMADYGRKLADGTIIKAGFIPSMLSQTPKLGAQPHGVGWFMIDWRGSGNEEVTIYFDFDGLRNVAEQILDEVRKQIAEMKPEELYKLRRVGERIPFFYVTPEEDIKPGESPEINTTTDVTDTSVDTPKRDASDI